MSHSEDEAGGQQKRGKVASQAGDTKRSRNIAEGDHQTKADPSVSHSRKNDRRVLLPPSKHSLALVRPPKRHGEGYEIRSPPRRDAPALVVTATDLGRSRQGIRTTLTVRRDDALIFRDRVRLDSAGSRAHVLRALKKKLVVLSDGILMQLAEACHTVPSPSEPSRLASTGAITPIDFESLQGVFDRWLLVEDRDLLPTFVGVLLSHRLDGELVWPQFVGPAGSMKTELIRSVYGSPGIYPLSALTPRTFASGLEPPPGKPDPSLLLQLKDQILLLKDFTSVLEMRPDDRREILSQLREIYDGHYDKPFGTGRKVEWEGRLGFVAGVTPVIDKHQGAMAILGERFVLFRIRKSTDRTRLALAALKSRNVKARMRRELAAAMRAFLAGRSSAAPALHPTSLKRLAGIADFITCARSPVQRHGWSRQLEYAPDPEAPTRFAGVLASLASGIALAYDSPRVTAAHLRLTTRVALDCLPPDRRQVLAALAAIAEDECLDTSGVIAAVHRAARKSGAVRYSPTLVRRALEDLYELRVVWRRKEKDETLWALHSSYAALCRTLEIER